MVKPRMKVGVMLTAGILATSFLGGPTRGQQDTESTPLTPVLETRGRHYDAGGPVSVRLSISNDGGEVVENPLVDPMPAGFLLTDPQGETIKPVKTGAAQPKQRPSQLAPDAYFGQIIDLAPYFPILAQEGKYTLVYSNGGIESNSVILTMLPPYNSNAVYTAKMKTRFGEISLDLFNDVAPFTVRNFVDLAREGFYDGLTFHYVKPGDMLVGGDPKGDGTGGSGFNIPPEFTNKKHLAGTVGMVRTNEPFSASSQFYITLVPQPERDGRFSVFAQVVDGFDVLRKMAEVPTTGRDQRPYFRPLEPLVIDSITIREETPSDS